MLNATESTSVPPGPIASETWVLADAHRLRQVVINLVVNAIRYNHRGGEVRVGISSAQGANAAGGEGPERETVRIVIADTGVGIDEASLSKLFVAFWRFHEEADAIPGSGLGLALSRSLTESMGGRIGVSSTLGWASTFWIDLPRAQQPAAQSTAEEHRPGSVATRAYARKLRLLYIEDTVSNLRFVEPVLRRRPSVEVLTVMMGNLGLELARELRPDLILLDLHLPDISGETVLAQLGEHPQTREIPVVVLSADATDAARAPLLVSGARAFISKPIGVVALLDLVDEFADGSA